MVGMGVAPVLIGGVEDNALIMIVAHGLASLAVLAAMARGIRVGRSAGSRPGFVVMSLVLTAVFVAFLAFVAALLLGAFTQIASAGWFVFAVIAIAGLIGGCVGGGIAAAILGYYIILAVKVPAFRNRLDLLLKLSPPPLPPVDSGQERGSNGILP